MFFLFIYLPLAFLLFFCLKIYHLIFFFFTVKASNSSFNILDSMIYHKVIPIISIIGIISNLLNLFIFGYRYINLRSRFKRNLAAVTKSRYAIEKATVFLFCAWSACNCLTSLLLLPYLFCSRTSFVFEHKSFNFFFRLYGEAFQYLFSHLGIWLAVVCVISQMICIREIHRAHIFVRTRNLWLTLSLILITVTVGHVPMLFKYSYRFYQGNLKSEIIYLLDIGWFMGVPEQVVSWLWLILGYFLPLFTFVFCIIIIIKELKSERIRFKTARRAVRRVVYLVCINAFLFLILQTPSQVFRFILIPWNPNELKKSFSKLRFLASLSDLSAILYYGFNCFICIVDKKQRITILTLILKCFGKTILDTKDSQEDPT